MGRVSIFSARAIAGVVMWVVLLITGIFSQIPFFTITCKRKTVSGMVTVAPVCLTGALVSMACHDLGFGLLKDAFARMVLMLLVLSWLGFALLSSMIEDYKCILLKDGIRFRKAFGFYHQYTYDEIRNYAKAIKPFVCRDVFCIYLGDRRAVLPMRLSIGGHPFLKELCKRIDLDYEEIKRQGKDNWKNGANMYYLAEKKVKEEKKRLRQEKKK